MAEDIYVYFVDLPEDVKEMATPCDGGYTVYINKKLSHDKAVKAIRHAVSHVIDDDWSKDDIQMIESAAHEDRDQNSLPISQIQFRIPD